nr:CHAT domain-containing protein [Iningainema tapete]
MLHNLGNILDITTIIESIQNRATKNQNLILVSHRDLHRFPLHALFPDEFTITYLPSAQLGLSHLEYQGGQDAHPTRQGNHHRLSLLSVEHPTSLGLPILEFAQIESETICRMFPNHTRLRSDEATTEQLKKDLPQGYNIFHFTGHGTYNFHNPALSYLALAGEDKLTLADIRDFDLRSYQLVSLAACETAITGNHTITTEYVGLVSGFMSCGVAHVISTLWTVESAASALVMMQFYQLLQ